MDHSVINQNHMRMVGIPVSDDISDKNRKSGMAHENVFIPFVTDGMTV